MKYPLPLFLFISLMIFPALASEKEISLSTDRQAQIIEGWGVSLCWWANLVGKWPAEETRPILEALTSPKQLNFNIFRYNIGGGDDPSHLRGHMCRGKGIRAEMEGFRPRPNVPYRWNADRGQRAVLLSLNALRPNAIFEAFSNSAPYWMTISKCSAGHTDPRKNNLAPERMQEFCTYLIDVCRAYRDRYGITFRTLDPFNEPQSDFWHAMGGQEGCHFDLPGQIQLIRKLYPALRKSGLPTELAVADENCLAEALRGIRAYEKAGDIWGKIGQINVHTYSGNPAERMQIQKELSARNIRLWQSETGPIGIKGYGLVNNLAMAQRLFDDMRLLRPVAWLDWQAMEEGNDIWCLFTYNNAKRSWRRVKNFYVRMQITRFFKQGYRMITTDDRELLAAISPDQKELVYAILNNSPKEQRYRLNLPPHLHPDTWRVYRTAREENCERIVLPELSAYTAPPHSLTTFVVTAKKTSPET